MPYGARGTEVRRAPYRVVLMLLSDGCLIAQAGITGAGT
jgi:hypothetical protein